MPPLSRFDAIAMFRAMDDERQQRGLSWRGVADEIWAMSAALNAERQDHPISPSTITNMARRGDTTCQHALFFLRWLGRAPESFTRNPPADLAACALPPATARQRLRWNLRRLSEAVETHRRSRGLTWPQAAVEIGCAPNQLSGLKTVRYAIAMSLAMRIVSWLGQPARTFVEAADW